MRICVILLVESFHVEEIDMRRRIPRSVLALVLATMFGMTIGVTTATAIDLGSILKGAGVAILVDRFSGQLNSFVNTITLNRNLGVGQATKVVPILSLGSGGYVGAAQVTGPANAVDRVQAVAQIEGNFSGRTFRAKALVPVNARSVTNIQRVTGVGVSAVIDVDI